MAQEYIPAEWIQTKKFKNEIELFILELSEKPEFKEITPAQICAAVTQAAANVASRELITQIRKRRGKGCVFHLPV